MSLRSTRVLVGTLILLVLYLMGIGVRRVVLETQFRMYGPEVPFTLESALQFRRISQLVEGGELPEVDTAVFYPDGVRTREAYSLGSEYLYAALARALPSTIPLATKVRWLEVCIFGLGIPFVALWLWWWLRSASGAVIGALYYAVGLASVIRSTGQELSRENLALPLLALHLALSALADRSTSDRAARLARWGSALVLGLALMSWDLIQYYLLLLGLVLAFRAVRRVDPPGAGGRSVTLPLVVVLTLCGVLNPYLRAHGFWFSPVLLLLWGAHLAPHADRFRGGAEWGTVWRRLAVVVVPAALTLLVGSFHQHYGHFGDLLWAKLRYLNEKPSDPAALTYAARIMWVPALHSADWALTRMLFPGMIPLTLIAVAALFTRPGRLRSPNLYHLLFFTTISLLTFWLFVRFHVFVALFMAGVAGAWVAWARERRGWIRWAIPLILLTGVGAEAGHVLTHPERWGRGNVYYRETRELMEKLAALEGRSPVLAGFGLSGSVLTYAGHPVVLHPKFESPEIRNRVREYGEVLFGGSEQAFRDWADQFGVRYYIHSKGQFSNLEPRYQMRYFANRMNPGPDVAARLLEDRPGESGYFDEIWSNRKYRLYRMLTRENEERARHEAARAQVALEVGDLDSAEQHAVSALELNPRQEQALKVLKHVVSLEAQGFDYKPEGAGT